MSDLKTPNTPSSPDSPHTETPSHKHGGTWIALICVALLALTIAFNVSC